MNDWLVSRDQALDDSPTIEAGELAVGDILDAPDVRCWSHTPNRVTYVVAAIEPATDGKLTISFAPETATGRAP